MGEQVSERESLAMVMHGLYCESPRDHVRPSTDDLRHADAALAWFAAHQPARVVPSAEDREALALGLWDDGIIRPEWLARQAVDRILDDPILSSQPTVAQVREQTLREAAEVVKARGDAWSQQDDDNPNVRARRQECEALLGAVLTRIARTETKGGE